MRSSNFTVLSPELIPWPSLVCFVCVSLLKGFDQRRWCGGCLQVSLSSVVQLLPATVLDILTVYDSFTLLEQVDDSYMTTSYIILYCTMLYHIVLYYTVSYCIVLYCIVLFFIIAYHHTIYCIISYIYI